MCLKYVRKKNVDEVNKYRGCCINKFIIDVRVDFLI